MPNQRRVKVPGPGGQMFDGPNVFPLDTLRRYAELVAAKASIRKIPRDSRFWAEIEGFPGVWASGVTEDAARATLQEVVFDWAMVKMRDRDNDLPIVGGIDLNRS